MKSCISFFRNNVSSDENLNYKNGFWSKTSLFLGNFCIFVAHRFSESLLNCSYYLLTICKEPAHCAGVPLILINFSHWFTTDIPFLYLHVLGHEFENTNLKFPVLFLSPLVNVFLFLLFLFLMKSWFWKLPIVFLLPIL